MLVENKVIKLIQYGSRNIVNLEDTGFWYCNGIIAIKCSYDNHKIIAKLFEIGAIKNYKDWKPEQTYDLSKIIKADKNKLYNAVFTGFYKKEKYKKDSTIVLKNTFDNKYCFFNELYLEIFADLEFKFLEGNNETIYVIDDAGEIVGVVLGIRDRDNETTNEIMSGILEG